MRILVVGAGAVGGFFGAKLAQAGRDVTFLVREQRAESIRADGLRIRPLKGDEFAIVARTVTARQLADGSAASRDADSPATTDAGPFDLVLLSVKSYALEQTLDDLAPAIGPGTVILPLLNGMRHIDILRECFGPGHVIGGLCLVAVQLDDDGAIRQVGPGGVISYGEFDGSVSERMLGVDAALADAGFTTTLSTTIEHDMWEKWMLLAAGGALTTLLRGAVGPIVAAPGGTAAATAIVDETFAVATAAGFGPRDEARTRIVKTLTETGSRFTTSMYRDLVQGRDVEADQVVGDLARRGRETAVDVTWLELAYTNLYVYRESLGAV
ncbi:MAG: apbA [Subtercola sp.]|nr:apbA [Subtercola sp.]